MACLLRTDGGICHRIRHASPSAEKPEATPSIQPLKTLSIVRRSRETASVNTKSTRPLAETLLAERIS